MKLRKDEHGSFTRDDDPGEPTSNEPRTSITVQEANILASYAVSAYVLEIGTGLGVSTRALASAADKVLTYDIDEWVKTTIWPELPSNVVPIESLDEARELYTMDIVFIDGDHGTEMVCADIQTARTFLAPNEGLIICHDANYLSVKLALGKEFGDDWVLIPTHHGLGVHVYKGEEQPRQQ